MAGGEVHAGVPRLDAGEDRRAHARPRLPRGRLVAAVGQPPHVQRAGRIHLARPGGAALRHGVGHGALERQRQPPTASLGGHGGPPQRGMGDPVRRHGQRSQAGPRGDGVVRLPQGHLPAPCGAARAEGAAVRVACPVEKRAEGRRPADGHVHAGERGRGQQVQEGAVVEAAARRRQPPGRTPAVRGRQRRQLQDGPAGALRRGREVHAGDPHRRGGHAHRLSPP